MVYSNSFSRRMQLLRQMLVRDIQQRYRGSLLGMVWAFITPLLLLGVYTFVFTVVFPARWSATESAEQWTVAHYALILFSGLILHNCMAEVLTRAPVIILQQVNLVKKVIFPLDILPLVVLGNALFHLSIGYGILALTHGLLTGTFSYGWLYIPVLLVPFVVLLAGLAWILAALGVFIRDIAQVMSLCMTILLFLSPVFYPISALPEAFQPWMYFNPLTFIVESTRAVLFYQENIVWLHWAKYGALSLVVALLGYGFFWRSRFGFADVL